MSNRGQRNFVIAVNLATGETESHHGSWGGANAFNPGNSVDLDTTARPLAPGFAIIHGSEGNGTRASITIHPSNADPLLPAAPALSDRIRYLLGCYRSLTSAGRKNQWADHSRDPKYCGPTQAEISEMVAAGLVTQNKAGAVSITTAGKNAAGRYETY